MPTHCILGIETSTALLSVAVVTTDGLLAERSVLGQKLHSIRLIPFIADVLREADLTLGDLTGIAVSVGPGSFTGLRLGIVTAKTLAQVAQLPVVAVPTLLALAAPLVIGGIPVCTVLTSRRGEVYAAIYTKEGAKTAILTPAYATSPAALIETLRAFGSIIVAGEGARALSEESKKELTNVVEAPTVFCHPKAAVVASIGLEDVLAGRAADPLSLQPDYLRSPAITMGHCKA